MENFNLIRTQLFWVMEQVVLLLLSQAVRYLIDPTIDDHSKQLLKRELSSELVSWQDTSQMTMQHKPCLNTTHDTFDDFQWLVPV